MTCSLKRLLCLALAIVTVAAFSAQAGAGDEVEAHYIVQALQSRYRSISSVSAVFTQEFYAFGFDKPNVSAGVVYLQKPGKMRWVYKSGSADILVSDGKTIWLFQPDLRQVVQTSADMGSTIATDFLSGMGDIREDFIVRLAEEKKEEVHVLELTPIRVQPNVKKVFLHVDRRDNMVVKTVVEDFFGNSTRVSFTNMELNMPIMDSFFTFKPPPGVTVIKE